MAWWKWVIDTIGRFNVEKMWDSIADESSFVRKNWSAILAAGGAVTGAILEHWSWTAALLAGLAAAGLTLLLMNQLAARRMSDRARQTGQVEETPAHVGANALPAMLAGSPDMAMPGATVAATIARWLFLKHNVDELSETHERLSKLEPEVREFLDADHENGYAEAGVARQCLDQWNEELRRLDFIVMQCLRCEDPNVSRMRYIPSEHPISPHLRLSDADAQTYRRFFEQLQALKSDGRRLTERIRGQERTARAQIYDFGRELAA